MQKILLIAQQINLLDILDILIVAFFIYRILLLLRGTRAFQLIKGVFFILFFYLFSLFLGLSTIDWLLGKLATIMLLIIIIVFQPELRRMLERIGQGSIFSSFVFTYPQGVSIVQNIVKATEILSEQRLGAIIAIEREIGLDEYIQSGIALDAKISNELILTVFTKNTPLHDGALILQGNRLIAATCLLPLSKSNLIDSRLGTRHRAALGLAEQTDAFVITISEETGVISIAKNGVLQRYLTKQKLENSLLSIYQKADKQKGFFENFFKKNK